MRIEDLETIITREEVDNKIIPDGVYNVEGLEVLHIPLYIDIGPQLQEVQEFMSKNPNWVLGQAYQVNDIFLISDRPTTIDYIGSGFNYGSGNYIPDCPKSILILAEDD